jgi:TatD DNase family protein
MRLIDAHIHLSDTEYIGHIDELIADARASGVIALVSNSMDLRTCINDIALAQKYPNLVYAALGIHPWNVNVLGENELQETIDLIKNKKMLSRLSGRSVLTTNMSLSGKDRLWYLTECCI